MTIGGGVGRKRMMIETRMSDEKGREGERKEIYHQVRKMLFEGIEREVVDTGMQGNRKILKRE